MFRRARNSLLGEGNDTKKMKQMNKMKQQIIGHLYVDKISLEDYSLSKEKVTI